MAPNSAGAQPIRSERSSVKFPGDGLVTTQIRRMPSALTDRHSLIATAKASIVATPIVRLATISSNRFTYRETGRLPNVAPDFRASANLMTEMMDYPRCTRQ